MKVCAVTTWPPHLDGIALYSAQLYRHMRRYVDVSIIANFTSSSSTSRNISNEGGMRVLRCWRRGSIIYPYKIFRCCLTEKPDIIHVQHGWLLYGNVISSLLFPVLLSLFHWSGRSCVVTMHTVIERNAQLYRNRIINSLARTAIFFITNAIVKLSSAVIVHNNLIKEILENTYSLQNFRHKIFVIPHGIRKVSKKPIFQKDGKTWILSLGFARKDKGIRYLIDAFKKFVEDRSNVFLMITGSRHAHDKIDLIKEIKQQLPREFLRKIFFTNFIDEETLDRLIWRSDIIVLHSLEHHFIEASGTLARVAPFEKPIICSKVPKFEVELEDGKNCLMIKPRDSIGLAKALALLAEDARLRETLGSNLKKSFRGREWSIIAKKHINLFALTLKK